MILVGLNACQDSSLWQELEAKEPVTPKMKRTRRKGNKSSRKKARVNRSAQDHQEKEGDGTGQHKQDHKEKEGDGTRQHTQDHEEKEGDGTRQHMQDHEEKGGDTAAEESDADSLQEAI